MRSRFSITAIFCLLFLITGILSAFAADPIIKSDDAEFVGQLKILARYNDSMQFYDGHTYLLFTSYQDGVTITVPDLYAGYEISDQYYSDIRSDISNGSNHTGTDTDKYFTLNKEMKSITLNRGEIVTIGMYRDFDLSVAQAALGTIMNSSAWTKLESAGKGAVVKTIFDFLDLGTISAEEALARIQAVFQEIGADFNLLIDGVVDGGVCFNRELYNQKLEWDQFENITFELDITREQLNSMVSTLSGNLNNFSIIKNSCATIAVKAWNAAVGDNSIYALDATGEGIFALVDAPKGVRDDMVEKLPGYYLNKSEGGNPEPNAGYTDETGWVYVSAPEKVTPAVYEYADDSIQIDANKTKPAVVITAAKGDKTISYSKDEQKIPVNVQKTVQDDATTINSIEFKINGTTVTADSGTSLPEGIWFKVKIEDSRDGEEYYVTDAEGKALPSDFSSDDSSVSFLAASLPVTYKVVGSSEGRNNILKTTVINGEDLQTGTKAEVYVKQNGEKVMLSDFAEVTGGTSVFIKPVVDPEEMNYALTDITLNGETIMVDNNYDAAESAYITVMPGRYSKLDLIYQPAVVYAIGSNPIQVSVGDVLTTSDHAELRFGAEAAKILGPENVRWKFIENDSVLEFADDAHKQLKALKEGTAMIWAGADSNDNIGVWFTVEIYENTSDMVMITFNEGDFTILAQVPGEEAKAVQYNQYLVKKGSELTIVPAQTESVVIANILANGKYITAGDSIVADQNTDITVTFMEASITGIPRSINLAKKDDSYQLNAEIEYKWPLNLVLPVYDESIRYESADPIIEVDETGKITVTGDVPAEGKAVIVTAYAGSSNDMVSAQCKVILGNYDGEKIVGKLTIHARPIVKTELIAHGAITLTAYEDLDLDISFYHYYKPTEKFVSLMEDYEKHPEKYNSDPALYNNDELGLGSTEIREKNYFEDKFNDSKSAPEKVSLKCGESLTLSDYGYGFSNIRTILNALENSSISSSENAQKLIAQLKLYLAGEEIDGTTAFDSLFATIVEIYTITRRTGVNPADGQDIGGMDINREAYNQFRRNDSQLPNNYYSVEITKDELAYLQSYTSDPANNYYSLFVKNCASSAVEMWNVTLKDRPELHLTANYTGIGIDPESLYFELGLMRLKPGLDGEAGTNFYPRLVASNSNCPSRPEPIDPEKPDFIPLCTDCLLPATGFSASYRTALSAQPKNLKYTLTPLRIQIPTIDLDTELVNVPLADNAWQVEWLGEQAGLLSGSAVPGKGLSIVAAHNTLNDTSFGPFALLSTLEINDSIFVNGEDNRLTIFRVYANELLDADGMEELLSIAETDDHTLALLTCENESISGGYLNRRVIFAKPVGEL